MKKNILKIGFWVGIVVLLGVSHAVASEGTRVREKVVVEEEPAMAVIPGSAMEAEKAERSKQSSKASPDEEEKKAQIPES